MYQLNFRIWDRDITLNSPSVPVKGDVICFPRGDDNYALDVTGVIYYFGSDGSLIAYGVSAEERVTGRDIGITVKIIDEPA